MSFEPSYMCLLLAARTDVDHYRLATLLRTHAASILMNSILMKGKYTFSTLNILPSLSLSLSPPPPLPLSLALSRSRSHSLSLALSLSRGMPGTNTLKFVRSMTCLTILPFEYELGGDFGRIVISNVESCRPINVMYLCPHMGRARTTTYPHTHTQAHTHQAT
jgi:hypothetical protein